jgi:hypothetical protein
MHAWVTTVEFYNGRRAHLLPVPLHPAGQPGARLRRPLVILPDRLGAVRLARRRRCGPSRTRPPSWRPSGADPGDRHRPPGDQAGTSFYIRLPGGTQTAWLERTRRPHRDETADWIIVQVPVRPSSSSTGNGSDLGIRKSGCRPGAGTRWTWCLRHDHDYERSLPVRAPTAGLGSHRGRGHHPAAPGHDHPGNGPTPAGTVHLILGRGGADARWTSTAPTPPTLAPGQGLHHG